jgi:cytoskeletal protein CcmA (bactofilin family)
MAVFGKKQKELVDSHIATIISEGCIIDGNITSNHSIKIDGIINGNIEAKQGVILGDTGRILGHVNALEAVVFGQIQGNIQTQKLEIRSTGKIYGDIKTDSIEMEFGAVYNGKVTMDSPSQKSTSKTSSSLEGVN